MAVCRHCRRGIRGQRGISNSRMGTVSVFSIYFARSLVWNAADQPGDFGSRKFFLWNVFVGISHTAGCNLFQRESYVSCGQHFGFATAKRGIGCDYFLSLRKAAGYEAQKIK